MKPEKLRSLLRHVIDSLDPCCFAKSPGRDFSRSRKLPFHALITAILRFEGMSMGNELLSMFPKAGETPSVSAFVQQRSKLRSGVFDELFRTFTRRVDSLQPAKTFQGLRLLAVDGSDILIPTDPQDAATFVPESRNEAPHNLLHLNAMYDLLQRTYVDEVIQDHHMANEQRAFVEMVDRSPMEHVLVIADRGYESFNNMAHVAEKNWYFLIRVKDVGSTGILSGLDLPTLDHFDVAIDLSLTRKQTNAAKELLQDRNHYRFLPSIVNFDYLPSRSRKSDPLEWYHLSFRAVRFPVSDGVFEVVLTNLPADLYPPDAISQLYELRWGIETSFRSVKYIVGLLYFHSKKAEYIRHEIVAKLIMYNLFELITAHVVIPKKDRKFDYQVNFSAAVHVSRMFFRGDISPPDLEAHLSRAIIPIRPGRKRKRKRHTSSVKSFNYRLS